MPDTTTCQVSASGLLQASDREKEEEPGRSQCAYQREMSRLQGYQAQDLALKMQKSWRHNLQSSHLHQRLLAVIRHRLAVIRHRLHKVGADQTENRAPGQPLGTRPQERQSTIGLNSMSTLASECCGETMRQPTAECYANCIYGGGMRLPQRCGPSCTMQALLPKYCN